jgi:GT2 family glycosyltransferase/glycosyltransferase involved in cell wall biosynthesis
MAEDERELVLRQRLADYIARRDQRAGELDRLSAALVAEASGPMGPTTAVEPAVFEAAVRLPASGLPPVTIAVPVHDAPGELERCIWSLVRNTTYPATLLLVDDASLDPRTDAVLEWAAGLEGVRLLRNSQNFGFAASVNRAFRASVGDVVVLNSDTEVGPRWLEQLVLAAYSDPANATVTPLSDNAGAFSAPGLDVANELPAVLSYDDAARLVAQEPDPDRPPTPTGNGFCLYVKRAAIEAVGELDAARFPRGYGEENDFCMRAGHAGWRHVIDGRTYVHHRREASFGAAKKQLTANARQQMIELHPDYPVRVREFIADDRMERARARVGAAMARGERSGPPRPRLLFVVHEGSGGAVATNRDLMQALGNEFECFAFTSDRHLLSLKRIDGASTEVLREWQLERPLLLRELTRPDYRDAFAAALEQCAPELVHVRHLFKHTFDPVRLTAAHELPTVVSFHDHYFICPTIHLLDDQGHYCAGECTPSSGDCPTVRAGSMPVLKHAFVYQWREEVEAAFKAVDAFVTTSDYTRDIHRRFLTVTRERPFELIEHGRDLAQLEGLTEAPKPGGPVRILVPGHLDRHKGAELLSEMCELDRDGRLELHFLGEVPERYRRLGRVHGAYERDTLADWVRDIRPAFVGVFSATGESYSHAVTEAWAAGVPVLATDLGAQAARVRAHGGGFVVPHADALAALRAVLAAADDRAAYAREQALARNRSLPTIAEMASRYSDLYREVIDGRRSLAAPPAARTSPLTRGLWHVTAFVSGSETLGPAAQLSHPTARWKLRATLRDHHAPIDAACDLVFVEQDALAIEEAEQLVRETARRGLPLVVSCHRSPDGGGTEATATLVAAARVLIVPTVALVKPYSKRPADVAVLPPLLDERALAGDAPQWPAEEDDPAAAVRLLYTARTPGAELDFLRSVLERLAEGDGRSYELEVVTADVRGAGDSWYRLVTAPDRRCYAEYLAALRELRSGWRIGLDPRLPGEGDARHSCYLEYAALGVPGIYGDTPEHVKVAKAGAGLTVGRDVDAWVEAIERLTSNPALSRRIAEAAWSDVTTGRLMRQGMLPLLSALGRSLSHAVGSRWAVQMPIAAVNDAG